MMHRAHGLRGLVFLAALLASAILPSQSSARDLEPDYQQWLQLQMDLKLLSKLIFNLDLQSRRMNAPLTGVKDPNGKVVDYTQNPNTMLLLRPSLGYQLLPWLSAWGGYAFTPVFVDDPETRGVKNISEHRAFEQLNSAFNFPRLALTTRTRLEQRFRSDGPGSSENDGRLPNWGHRLRQLARAQFTLCADKPWLAVVWDEVFVHLNDTNFPSERGFDQNRAFLGVGYQASQQLRAEVGYMNQYVRRFTDPNQLNHILSASIAFRFDLSQSAPN